MSEFENEFGDLVKSGYKGRIVRMDGLSARQWKLKEKCEEEQELEEREEQGEENG